MGDGYENEQNKFADNPMTDSSTPPDFSANANLLRQWGDTSDDFYGASAYMEAELRPIYELGRSTASAAPTGCEVSADGRPTPERICSWIVDWRARTPHSDDDTALAYAIWSRLPAFVGAPSPTTGPGAPSAEVTKPDE